MIGSGLKRLAREYGLTVECGAAFGRLKGCEVSLSEGAGYKRMCIYVGCHHASDEDVIVAEGELPAHMEAANNLADFIIEQAGDFKKYRLMTTANRLLGVMMTQGGSIVQLNFFDNPGTLKCVRAFIEDILPQVAPMTEPDVCVSCGEKIESSAAAVMLGDGAVAPAHSACADELDSAFAQLRTVQKGSVIKGALGAEVGALIGAAAWCAVGMMGYIASIVGFLIAWLSGKGYDLMGGKPGRARLITVLICVVLAVVIGNVACVGMDLHQAYTELQAELALGEQMVSEGEFAASILPELQADAEYMKAFWSDMGLGLLFALLGCVGMLRDSANSMDGGPGVLRGRIDM